MGFFIEAKLEIFGTERRLGAVVKRIRKMGEGRTRGDGADPIEMAAHDAVFGAGRGHADDFLVRRDGRKESQDGDQAWIVPASDGFRRVAAWVDVTVTRSTYSL